METVGVRKLMYEGNCSRFFSRFDPNRAQLNWFPLGEKFQEQPARGLTAWVSSLSSAEKKFPVGFLWGIMSHLL